MRVTCKANTANAIPPGQISNFVVDPDQAVFHISVGTEYFVSAMALYKSSLILLLVDDTEKPNWYPIQMFSVIEGKLPSDWFFSTTVATQHGVDAVWGYEQLVANPKHYEELIERDPDALRAFKREGQAKKLPD
jgi:hypothetical protein